MVKKQIISKLETIKNKPHETIYLQYSCGGYKLCLCIYNNDRFKWKAAHYLTLKSIIVVNKRTQHGGPYSRFSTFLEHNCVQTYSFHRQQPNYASLYTPG